MAVDDGAARRRVTVLGATGSIGRSTLDLIGRQPERFEVEALTANRDVEGLAAAARATRCRLAAIADPSLYGELQDRLAGSGIEVAAGPASMVEAAERPADWVMSAILGAAGLAPTLAAVRRGALVAFATKEALVCAGALLMAEVERAGTRLLPVDSEHNAIFQALRDERPAGVEKLVLTASGGPFRDVGLDVMAKATPAEAIAHPNWSMGAKISVDSATMMNKGLELIEAHYLFQTPEDRIEILVHPESIIHSLVAFRDGSMLAQLGQPDMRIPIAYTLGWPERLDVPLPRLDLRQVAQLNFHEPDPGRFPALRIARDALRAGGSAPTVLNAANEVAVAAYLAGRIGFLDIALVVERTLERVTAPPAADLDHIVALDQDARARAGDVIAAIPRTRAG